MSVIFTKLIMFLSGSNGAVSGLSIFTKLLQQKTSTSFTNGTMNWGMNLIPTLNWVPKIIPSSGSVLTNWNWNPTVLTCHPMVLTSVGLVWNQLTTMGQSLWAEFFSFSFFFLGWFCDVATLGIILKGISQIRLQVKEELNLTFLILQYSGGLLEPIL